MSTVTFNPAVPAVTKVVTPEVPATVTLTLSLEDAAKLKAVAGAQCCLTGLYLALHSAAEAGHFPNLAVKRDKHPAISVDDLAPYNTVFKY